MVCSGQTPISRSQRLLVAVALGLLGTPAIPCDFCAGGASDFTPFQDLVEKYETIALAEPRGSAGPGRTRFRVKKVVRGNVTAGADVEISTLGFAMPRSTYLLLGDESGLTRATPVNPRAALFVQKLVDLPGTDKPVKRLRFLLPFLRDVDATIAASAMAEYAKAPFTQIEKLKPELDAELLARWAIDKRTPRASRGILILLLGVCAGEPQLRQMAAWLEDERWQQQSGYDALIAAYWLRRGPAGLAEVQGIIEKIDAGDRPPPARSFLRALRFHENENTPVTKEQTLAALRDFLRYPEAAELTLFELRRRKDWASLPAVIELHKKHIASHAWLIGPVRDYLRGCPKPEARAFLKTIAGPK